MMNLFDCDDVGNMEKYVGCYTIGYYGFTFTQSVMLQIFRDEFEFTKQVTTTPAITGKTLMKTTENYFNLPEETTYFHKGVGKYLHMMKWSRPEIYNLVRDLSHQMIAVTKDHIDVMHRAMDWF